MAYFADQAPRRNYQTSDQPAGTPTSGALDDDVQAGTLPTVGILIPNMCHEAHNCPLSAADDWLQHWLAAIMQGPDYRAGHLAIVITFDEDDRSGANTVLTTVIAPTVRHVISATPLTHYSLTRYLAGLSAPHPQGKLPPHLPWATPSASDRGRRAGPDRASGGAIARVVVTVTGRVDSRVGTARIAETAGSAMPAQVERGRRCPPGRTGRRCARSG